MESYGEILAKYRKNFNVSKKKLAELLSIDLYDIYCFEENLKKPNIKQMEIINNFFGVKLENISVFDSSLLIPAEAVPEKHENAKEEHKRYVAQKIKQVKIKVYKNELDYTNYSGALVFWRKKLGLTKKEFSEKVKINLYDIYCFEEDIKQPNEVQRQLINQFFGFSLDEAIDKLEYEERIINIVEEELKINNTSETEYHGSFQINFISFFIFLFGIVIVFISTLVRTKDLAIAVTCSFAGFSGLALIILPLNKITKNHESIETEEESGLYASDYSNHNYDDNMDLNCDNNNKNELLLGLEIISGIILYALSLLAPYVIYEFIIS